MKIDCLLLGAMALVCYSFAAEAHDPWEEAEDMLRQAVKWHDPIDGSSEFATEGHSVRDPVLYIPIDYYDQEQKESYSYFWSHIANDWQKAAYTLLQESSDKYNNAEATYTLAQLHLWGHYNFPHNKTLAFKYSEKFNNLTSFTNSSVLFDLSVMHSTGLFGEIPIDSAKALVYLQHSASLGNIQAKQALAYKYYSGTNVPRDSNKALLIYREVAEIIRESFTEEEWHLYPPYEESYNLRIPDFCGGLLGKGLSSMALSTRRIASERPDIASSFLTKMDGSRIWLHFGNGNSGGAFTSGDDESDDRLVDIYYTALDEYKGTYMKRRDCERAMRLLKLTYEAFDNDVPSMDNLQRYFYAKCLDLLGHMYFTGEGHGHPDISLAEVYLKRSIEIIETYSSITSRSHIDLGLIAQYIYKNNSKAIEHYRRAERSGFNDGRTDFQLSKLTTEYPEMKLGDPFILMQSAYSKGLRPAVYEFARLTEGGANDRYSCEDTAFLFKSFVEGNEEMMAPQLRVAYGELLKENGEVALWAYAQAAEQGFETAQISAAYMLYQLPHNFEEPPVTLPERKLMAISYYVRAFKQGNIDAGVVAGDMYYGVGDYNKSIQLYQSSALKFSPQALWNLGYMYEHGFGVEKDFHMAKRYYDQVLENSSKLYIPVKLSVLKLRLKLWCSWLFGSDMEQRYEHENYASDQSEKVDKPWYKKLVQSYKNAFNGNSAPQDDRNRQTQDPSDEEAENLATSESTETQENFRGIRHILRVLRAMSLEDLMTIGLFFSLILFGLAFRVIARVIAGIFGLHVRDNGMTFRINAQDRAQNAAQNGGQNDGQNGAHDPAQNAAQNGAQEGAPFRGNFEIQIFAI